MRHRAPWAKLARSRGGNIRSAGKLLLAIAVVFLGACARTPEWKEYASREGGYVISFPATPRENTRRVDENIVMHEVTAELGERAFLVTYTDYPELGAAVSTEERIERWRRGRLRDHTLVSEREITLDGLPGREFVLESRTRPFLLSARLYFRGNRGYQVLVAEPRSEGRSGDAEKFFASLRFVAQ